MKKLLFLMVGLCIIAGPVTAKVGHEHQVMMIEDSQGLFGDISNKGLFGVAQAGTTWIGWSPTGAGPYSIGAPGYWDFDDRGTLPCPVDDFTETSPVYIKNGAYAQYWTSEDVFAQTGIYWHADDFTSVPGAGPITGTYSAWCGVITGPGIQCFTDAPGYGHNWNQWLCKSLTLSAAPGLSYNYRNDTEPGFDYTYLFIDSEFPDSCGWVGDNADTLRCYDGTSSGAEAIDLAAWADGSECDETPFAADYSNDSVKVCFMVLSDGGWDDQDGSYNTADGAFVVDDIVLDGNTTDFETGTLEGWETCGGWSPGDWAAVRDRSDFINNDPCGFDNCTMSGCVLAFYNSLIPGQYGNGGHYAGSFFKRAWSPPIDMTSYPTRGYMITSERYVDLPISNWIFYRYYARYWQDPDCLAGQVSPATSDNYVYYADPPACDQRTWGFSQFVPTDADSVQIALAAWAGCEVWGQPCTNGNESPIFDDVKLGIFDLTAPQASLRAVDNYCDAFPYDDALAPGNTALIDAANNKSQEGYFLRLADSLVISLTAPNAQAELCFRIEPGPGTNLGDPFFASDYVNPGGWTACELSTGDETEGFFCTRMDTALAAGDGDTASSYEFQTVFKGYYASLIHEADPLYAGEGEEIFPDSLFTPGTKIYYAIRTKFVGDPNESWLPFAADLGNDVTTAFEVEVLPDLCKDPVACLLYVDYYNRGAQVPIEDALTRLGRTWDRFDLRAESSHQGNGIGNRLLGPGRYLLDRAPIGPSLAHLAQYGVMMVNSGHFSAGTCFSDGGKGTPDDPTNDVTFMDNWISEGPAKGLWLSGDGIASDFGTAAGTVKPAFLANELATQLVASSYRIWSGHPIDEECTGIKLRDGEMKVVNTYSVLDSICLRGSGCPDRYDFDVIEEVDGATGNEFVSAMYDLSGGYASVDHIFTAPNAPFDTVRTKIDGFSLHALNDCPDCDGGTSNTGIALWVRDVLGGNDVNGYFYDTANQLQYCPPFGPEDPTIGLPRGGRTYSNALFQNYPNPFRGGAGTTIHYSVAKTGKVEVRIFDVAGRLVNTIVDQADLGDNFVVWDGKGKSGRSVPSGVYFYQINTGEFKAHKKMLLVN